MRVVCSYCHKLIRADRNTSVMDVSHGMCVECADHFDRLWSGMPVGEYLDGMASPVLLSDERCRIIAMNQKLADILGVERTSATGLLGGEAFACIRSRLPEGCGRTVHCRDCAVRRTIEEVARTKRPKERVTAYLDRPGGRVRLRISATPAKLGIVQVKVEEVGPASPPPKDA